MARSLRLDSPIVSQLSESLQLGRLLAGLQIGPGGTEGSAAMEMADFFQVPGVIGRGAVRFPGLAGIAGFCHMSTLSGVLRRKRRSVHFPIFQRRS